MSVLAKRSFGKRFRKDMRKHGALYLLVLPVVVYYLIFNYKPMYGLLIAFKDYRPALGIVGSPWTDMHGFKHFVSFFSGAYLGRLVRNTLLLSLYSFLFGFPSSLILALLLNEIGHTKFKRVVQTITYFPHFISVVVIAGLLIQFSSSKGIFNDLRSLLGMDRAALLQQPKYYRTIYIASDIWQGVGWGSIIYLAAIAGADPQLYEAASIDGAGRLRLMWHITLPAVRNTVVILLIMNTSGLLNIGSEKTILLYNPSIYETADIISTYVYRKGLVDGNYSYAAAVGLMNSIISLLLVLIANKICARVADYSLF